MEEEKKEIVRKYTNGEVTIVWQPRLCIHSTFCWRESPDIFDPDIRPWVHASGVSSEKIIQQVERCPSKALTYYYNGRKNEPIRQSKTPATAETQIKVIPNGPLMVTGNVEIINEKGEAEIRHNTMALCRCGGTKNPPYCDGTHVKIHFKG